MIDLIKVAEKQIERLEEYQMKPYTNAIDESKEIRSWCAFIKLLDLDNEKITEKFSDDTLGNIPTNKLVKEIETREGIEIKTIDPYQDEEINVNGPCILIKVIDYAIRL